MKTIKLSIQLLMLVFGMAIFAQSDGDEFSNSDAEIFNSEQEGLNLLSSILDNNNSESLEVQNSNSIYNNYSNSVIVQQIGDYNSIYTNTKSQTSSIQLIQSGNYNDINLNINAPDIQSSILQQGDNNSVHDLIYYTNRDVELNVSQNGNNLSVNRIGVNSLTEKIQIVQEGSFKTITLISN